MIRTRSNELDFGPLEKTVRWIEETSPDSFSAELERRLSKLRPDGADGLLTAAALAAARSVRFEGNGRCPHGLLVLGSARAVASALGPDRSRPALTSALRLVNAEIHDPGFGPYRLLDCAEVAGEGREGTLFSFLEAVRAGETDWADHRFAWLVRNLEKDQVVDVVLSSGLEGVTRGVHKVIGVVEVAGLLQAIGWQWAPVLLRPIVRHQASGWDGLVENEECREIIESRDLLQVARRRPPGQPSLGERDGDGFLQDAIRWAESAPRERSLQIASLLAEGVPLEDAGDLIALGSALLLLQEMLRQPDLPPGAAEMERRVHLVTGPLAMRQLVRLGTPGQRILGLLLAGSVPPACDVRFAPRSPDCGWWLAPLSHLVERGGAPAELPVPAAWAEMVEAGQCNGLLPLLTERLEAGGTAAELESALAVLGPRLSTVPGLAMKLERGLADAYRGSRNSHRWVHRWAAAVALALWPRGEQIGSLRSEKPAAIIPG